MESVKAAAAADLKKAQTEAAQAAEAAAAELASVKADAAQAMEKVAAEIEKVKADAAAAVENAAAELTAAKAEAAQSAAAELAAAKETADAALSNLAAELTAAKAEIEQKTADYADLESKAEYKGLTFDQLMDAQKQLSNAMWASEEWEAVVIPCGIYAVGKDIPEGRWTIRASEGPADVKVGKYLDETGNQLVEPYVMRFVDDKSLDYNIGVVWNLQEGSYLVVDQNPVTFTQTPASSFVFITK